MTKCTSRLWFHIFQIYWLWMWDLPFYAHSCKAKICFHTGRIIWWVCNGPAVTTVLVSLPLPDEWAVQRALSYYYCCIKLLIFQKFSTLEFLSFFTGAARQNSCADGDRARSCPGSERRKEPGGAEEKLRFHRPLPDQSISTLYGVNEFATVWP